MWNAAKRTAGLAVDESMKGSTALTYPGDHSELDEFFDALDNWTFCVTSGTEACAN